MQYFVTCVEGEDLFDIRKIVAEKAAADHDGAAALAVSLATRRQPVTVMGRPPDSPLTPALGWGSLYKRPMPPSGSQPTMKMKKKSSLVK